MPRLSLAPGRQDVSAIPTPEEAECPLGTPDCMVIFLLSASGTDPPFFLGWTPGEILLPRRRRPETPSMKHRRFRCEPSQVTSSLYATAGPLSGPLFTMMHSAIELMEFPSDPHFFATSGIPNIPFRSRYSSSPAISLFFSFP